MTSNRVLITGASSGIGLELAREFASNAHELVLVARDEDQLQSIADDLAREYGTTATVLAADLTDEEAPQQIFDQLHRLGLHVQILVNNAGSGFRGRFAEISMERDITTLRLNAEAVVRLTKFFLPPMLSRKAGRILNVASVAAFEPGPLMAVYHATKSFVLSFSQALAVELKDDGITVTALCPGATDTEFFPKANMTQSRIFQKGNLMSPREVAQAGYKALMRGDALYVPGGLNKALAFMRRVTTKSAQAKFNKKFYEDVKPAERKRKPDSVAASRGRRTIRSTAKVPRSRYLREEQEREVGH